MRYSYQCLKLNRRRLSTQASLTRWPGWESVIGIEVHAQIKSRQKLFSHSLTSNDEAPNSRVSLFDAAFPGTLPVLNKKCVDLAIRTALALNAQVQHRSAFDRKHYFYSDLPSGYQITQNYAPVGKGGALHLEKAQKSVRIKQIQLEQDTAKSTFSPENHITLIDLNRAGTGLLEIVSEPDMRSPEEAGAYVRALQALLRTVGASDGNMELGSLRCDVNVSVNRIGESFGTRCEIKNLNTIKGLQVAIAAEVLRHIELLSKSVPITQETRGFDEDTGQTFKLRSKEDAPEYRYMPDPNLPPLILTDAYIDRIRSTMPELPSQISSRLQLQYGLNARDTEVLLSMNAGSDVPFDGELPVGSAVQYFEEASNRRDPKSVVNWITHDLLGSLSHRNEIFSHDVISVQRFGGLIDLVHSGTITGTSGKTLLRHLLQTKSSEPLETLVDTLGLRALEPASLSEYCQKAIADLPREAAVVRAGNDKVVMKLVGYVMKLSNGTADAQAAREMLKDSLRSEGT